MAPFRLLFFGVAFLSGVTAPGAAGGPFPSFPVTITVDAAQTRGEVRPIWRFFGADEPNYATMRNGRRLITELGELKPQEVFFRTHNLFCTGDGTPALKWGSTNVYTEDPEGNPVYDWKIVDGIFDTYLAQGVRPYVELGFMPQAMSVKPQPYQHRWTPEARYNEIYTGWSYPPKDYAKWAELVYRWTRHLVEKYGRAEVDKWYWEVWNEANIGYWRGTPEEFRKLHDYAIDAVRRALPTARVGGPDSAGSGGPWMRDFLEHCLHGTNDATGRAGTPLDFVSFHAKGSPEYVDGHVRMGIANELRTADDGFRIIASYPELKNVPVIIGECDPEGCAACAGPQLGYRNGTMYSSYTAASFARLPELAERAGVNLEGALTWAFEFENQPYFAGFRSLATNGIDKPVMNVFRMFSFLNGQRLAVQSSGAVPLETVLKDGVRGAPDVSAVACRDHSQLCVLVWHYHDDDVSGPDAAVTLTVAGLRSGADSPKLAAHFRIDETHSNAFATWKRMGSPPAPTPGEYRGLERSGGLELLDAPVTISVHDGQATMGFSLPRQAVSLLVLELPN
jgi:xylan 1,4-beta-xylosidase